MKKLIKKIFNSLGLEISRIDRSNESIIDVIKYNSKENAELFYASEKSVNNYISVERLNFYEEILRLLTDRHKIDLSNQKNIADMGCGTGHLLKIISERYPKTKLSGFEISDNAIKLAKNNCSKADYYNFDIYKGYDLKFELLISSEVIEHLLYPDKALEKLKEMLEINGTIFISVPNGRIDTFKGHINYWSKESWKVFIEQHFNDFSLVITDSFNNGNNLYALVTR